MTIKEVTQFLIHREYTCPNDIRVIFSSISNTMLEMSNQILRKGQKLYRERIVEIFSEIQKISDLSYVPKEYNKTYSRASTPQNTMFYGVNRDSDEDSYIGCLAETCECIRLINAPAKHYNVIIGIWKTERNFWMNTSRDIIEAVTVAGIYDLQRP